MYPSDLNKSKKHRHFPLKTVEDIAASVGVANFFTFIAAKSDFEQLLVSERTSDYVTITFFRVIFPFEEYLSE